MEIKAVKEMAEKLGEELNAKVVPVVTIPLEEYEELIDLELRFPKRVYLNPPYSIVVLEDGGKSQFKAQSGDEYDPLTGLLMCCMHGQTHNRVAVKDYEDVLRTISENVSSPAELLALSDALECAAYSIAGIDGTFERMAELYAEKDSHHLPDGE